MGFSITDLRYTARGCYRTLYRCFDLLQIGVVSSYCGLVAIFLFPWFNGLLARPGVYQREMPLGLLWSWEQLPAGKSFDQWTPGGIWVNRQRRLLGHLKIMGATGPVEVPWVMEKRGY